MNDEVKCKICGKVMGPARWTNGNTHKECYWAWVHGTLKHDAGNYPNEGHQTVGPAPESQLTR